MKTSYALSGIPLAWADRCAIAVRQILAGNQKLAAFTEGKVRRCVLMALPAGIPTDCILVSASLPRLKDGAIGSCTTLLLPIQIGVCWEQPMELLEDEDATIAAIFAEIIRELVAHPTLKVPTYGNQRLVDKITDIRPLGPPLYQGGQGSVTLLDSIEVEFEVELDATVWDIE